MKAEPPPGYATSRELYELDKKLRKRYCLSSRANLHAFRLMLTAKKIRSIRNPVGGKLWNVEHFFDVFITMYDHNGNFCKTRVNIERSHLIAPQSIRNDPNYLPLQQAAKSISVKPARIAAMVDDFSIIPYYDPDKKRLLFPVKECQERLYYRRISFIENHMGMEQAAEIRATRAKRSWNWNNRTVTLYHVPELAHL